MSKIRSNLEIVSKQITKDLEIEGSLIRPGSLEELTAWLDDQITILLEKDFQKLLNLLYRVDIDELNVRKAFADDRPSRRLAELIIDRELQKVETRRKYR